MQAYLSWLVIPSVTGTENSGILPSQIHLPVKFLFDKLFGSGRCIVGGLLVLLRPSQQDLSTEQYLSMDPIKLIFYILSRAMAEFLC